LELASVHSVDVVIVDYVMPEMNGQGLAVEMKRLKPHAPIMLCGTADAPDQALKYADVLITRSLLRVKLLARNGPVAGVLNRPLMRAGKNGQTSSGAAI
jgi:CheY-like chemotaxis protein